MRRDPTQPDVRSLIRVSRGLESQKETKLGSVINGLSSSRTHLPFL